MIPTFPELKTQVERKVRELVQKAGDELTERANQLQRELLARVQGASPTSEIRYATEEWSADAWTSFNAVPADALPPRLIRIGTFHGHVPLSKLSDVRLAVPGLVSILGGRSLAIETDGTDGAAVSMEAVLLRLLASLPPKQLRITTIDPVGLGNSFRNLNRIHERVRGAEPRTLQTDISAEIDRTVDTISRRTSQLRSATLEEYNARAGVTPEPYIVLAIAGFPAGFSRPMAEQLGKVLENGPRVGVLCIMTWQEAGDPQRRRENGVAAEHALAHAMRVVKANGQLELRGPNVPEAALTVALDGPPPNELLDRIGEVLLSAWDRQRRPPVSGEALLPPHLWKEKPDGLSAPIGLAGTDRVILEVGRDRSHHVLIGGDTGSGKTALLHMLILSLASRYSPGDLELHLVDFKEGVEFRPYATLPHARTLVIMGARERGLDVLRNLEAEMVTRGRLFKARGVNRIHDYRKHEPMPFIVLLVDEFHRLFSGNDGSAAEASRILERLAKEGRGFGLHLILASQRPPTGLSADARGQLRTRIALRMNEADMAEVLGSSEAAAQLNEPGEAVFNEQAGARTANKFFRAARLTEREVAKTLARLANEAASAGFTRKPVVHDGSTVTTQAPRRYSELLPSEVWNAHVSDGPLATPFGWGREGPVELSVHGTKGQSALVVGAPGSGKSVLLHAIITGLCTRYSPRELELYLVDFGSVELQFYESLPHARVVSKNVDVDFGLLVLSHLVGEMAERTRRFTEAGVQDLRQYRATKGDLPIALLVMDEFQVLFPDLGQKSALAGKMLENLVRQGRKYGIHVILATQSLGGVHVPPAVIRAIMIRIALRMRPEDFRQIMSENTNALSQLRAPGDGILNEEGGAESANVYFHGAYVEAAVDLPPVVTDLAARAQRDGFAKTPRIVAGGAPAILNRSEWIQGAPSTEHAEFLSLIVGETWSVDGRDSGVLLDRRRGSNLMIIAADPTQAMAALLSSIFSARHGGRCPRVLALDYSRKGALSSVLRSFTVSTPAPAQQKLEDMQAEIDRRSRSQAEESLLVVLWSAHEVRDLPRFGATLTKLVERGPAEGVHFVLCLDAWRTADRLLARGAREHFENRLALGCADAAKVVKDVSVNDLILKEHQCLLVTPATPEGTRMRTYGPADMERAINDIASCPEIVLGAVQ